MKTRYTLIDIPYQTFFRTIPTAEMKTPLLWGVFYLGYLG